MKMLNGFANMALDLMLMGGFANRALNRLVERCTWKVEILQGSHKVGRDMFQATRRVGCDGEPVTLPWQHAVAELRTECDRLIVTVNHYAWNASAIILSKPVYGRIVGHLFGSYFYPQLPTGESTQTYRQIHRLPKIVVITMEMHWHVVVNVERRPRDSRMARLQKQVDITT